MVEPDRPQMTIWRMEPDRPQMTIWRMLIACWIPKAIDTHSEYVTLTTATVVARTLLGVKSLQFMYRQNIIWDTK